MDLSKQNTRDAKYELLRIIAMFSIVLYHVWLFYLPDLRSVEYPIVSSFFPLMHIGVPIFFLISGYFSINATWKGLLTFVSVVAIYYLPLSLYHGIRHGEIISSVLFLSNTSCYWFVRAYLYLYLLAPAINSVLKTFDRRKCLTWIIILATISMYFGFYNVDGNLDDRSIFNVVLLYSVGWYIRRYIKIGDKSIFVLLLVFIVFNFLSVITRHCTIANESAYSIHNNLFFNYNSVGCIGNAIILFLLFGKLKIKERYSKCINIISSSMFAVYLISGQPLIQNYCIAIIKANSGFLCTGGAMAIFVICIGIDKLMYPLWKLRDNQLKKYQFNKPLY